VDSLMTDSAGRVPPAEYQPALGAVDHAWRYAVCLALSLLFWSWVEPGQRHHPGLLALDLGLGAVSYVLVAFRRRAPFAIAFTLNVMAVWSGIAGGPAVLAAVSLATRRIPREVLLITVTIFAASTAFYYVQPFSPQTSLPTLLLVNLLFASIQIGWGMYLGSRREIEWRLERRARAAEAERDERVRSARTAERSRIAREMHDVLAHRISQISLYAGALSFREDLDADTMRAGVKQIQGNAHQALAELRDVLGVLREQEHTEPLARPQPTYDDLHELVDETRATGTVIDFTAQVSEGVPDQVGRTLYRVAQEGLTNARKHAPGAIVRLDVIGDPGAGIDLWVRNAAGIASTATPGAGLGLVGLRERVELSGGSMEAAVAGEDHVLHVWLPWKVPS